MVRTDVTRTAAPAYLGGRSAVGAMGADLLSSEALCTTMRIGEKNNQEAGSQAVDPVCGKLKAIFDDVANTPMPLYLERLAEELDAALDRGELTPRKPKS
jgi:hypothetical protein